MNIYFGVGIPGVSPMKIADEVYYIKAMGSKVMTGVHP